MRTSRQTPFFRGVGWITLTFFSYVRQTIGQRVECATDNDCQLNGGLSICRGDGYCSNPYETGCLNTLMPDAYPQKRVCNSQDAPNATALGICRPPTIEEYTEVRIFAQNWESSYFEAWLLQIVLSELLQVPTSIETGSLEAKINFYDQHASYDAGTTRDWQALENGAKYGDCRLATQDEHNASSYEPCAHIATEVWSVQNAWLMADEGVIEPPQGLGVLGLEGWYTPKFTAENDSTILSFYGLMGEENRQKMAEMFLRPTTWQDYCKLVSTDNCTTPDQTAQRAPQDNGEKDLMFANGLYTGHFRATEANNCTLNPTTCTGHIGDFPCSWSSFITPQVYHLNISLDPQRYSPSQLADIWRAANATKSHVLMYWWTPDILYEEFGGSPAEFSRITLPPPTQKCIENRVLPADRCGENAMQPDNPLGICDETPTPLQKLISTGLRKAVQDPSIPMALKSPALEAAKLFSLTSLQLSELFEYWRQYKNPRDAVCHWIVDSMDWAQNFVPPNYPRTLEQAKDNSALSYAATTIAFLVSLLVCGTTALVYRQRKRRVMLFAQVEFLMLLLLGLLIISIGSIVIALPTKDGTCVAAVWLINVGYTVELVPLIVKISAINRVVNGARSFRRIVIRRSQLIMSVAVILATIMIFLTFWTIFDPPRANDEYVLVDEVSDDGYTVVQVYSFCRAGKDAWAWTALAWNSAMLLWATVLAIRSRNITSGFNESQPLAIMIYSHALFLILRIALFRSMDQIDSRHIVAFLESFIYSADVMATIAIYFAPKLCSKDNPQSISQFGVSGFSSDMRQSFDAHSARSFDIPAVETGSMTVDSSGNCKCHTCGQYTLKEGQANGAQPSPTEVKSLSQHAEALETGNASSLPVLNSLSLSKSSSSVRHNSGAEECPSDERAEQAPSQQPHESSFSDTDSQSTTDLADETSAELARRS